MTCKGCGVPLEFAKGPGRPRIWCSDQCRKRQYGGACVVCGAPTNGSSGWAAPEHCAEHNPGVERARAARNASKKRRWERITELYRADLSYKEIAATMGCTVSHISADIGRMRIEGWPIGYRYPEYRRNPGKAA